MSRGQGRPTCSGPKPGVDHAPTIAFLETVLRNCRRRLTTARAVMDDRRQPATARADAAIDARQLAASIDHFTARLARFADVDEATSRGGAHRSALPRPATAALEELMPAGYQGRWRAAI